MAKITIPQFGLTNLTASITAGQTVTSSFQELTSYDGIGCQFIISASTTQSISGSILAQVGNDRLNYFTISSIPISGTTILTGSALTQVPWRYIQYAFQAVAASGTGSITGTLNAKALGS